MAKRTQTDLNNFKKRIEKDVLTHRIITNNHYTKWFKDGNLTVEDVRFFAQQFSVFSNLFLIAQLRKTINAVSLEEMRKSKEILANEIGCIFNRKTTESKESLSKRAGNAELEGDPALVNTEGTVDGGTFRFKAAHFEWLLDFGNPLGLTFKDMGKRSHGSKSTLFFCDELSRLYGSEDFNVGAGSSYSVENWAAAGFWKELVQGLKIFKASQCQSLPLAFFTWHDKVEDQHKAHTEDELAEIYFEENFDENKFIKSAKKMLDGVATFWDGLNEDRLKRNKINVKKVAASKATKPRQRNSHSAQNLMVRN